MLYHSTLVDASPKTAICGRFSGKAQQIITLSSSGNALYLYSHDPDSGSVTLVHKHHTFAQVRQIRAFRLPGLKKDYVLASSDSGVVAVLEYTQNRFVSLHKEAYGRSGVRRVVPGEYLAVDPKGRACLLASVEKSKLVYVLNRQGSDITISSPLEAHTHCVTYMCVALDVGYDNPVFAAVEVVEGGKRLVLYELDLGLNHVIRKAPVDVPQSVSHLASVPGGNEGPGGVLVFSTNAIVHHVDGKSSKIALPRSSYDNTVVVSALHQSRDLFFYLVQNTRGDLFKVSYSDSIWSVMFFGTISVCTSLTILKSAHIIALSEQGDSYVYFFESLGDDDDVSNTYEPCPSPYLAQTQVLFERKPVFDAVVNDSGVLSITSTSSSGLKTISSALTPSIIVASPLPEPPSKLWTIGVDGSDKYIVLSYANATLVLEIGDSVVETSSSGLILDRPTIHCGSVGDSIVQIHSLGLRVVHGETHTAWNTPQGRRVVCASSSSHQVVLALDDRLVYFEDAPGAELSAYEGSYELPSPPTAVAVAPVPKGRVRSPFVAVASEDETVRIVSVDPEAMFETVAVQGLMAAATSIALLPVGNVLYLHMGLANGVYVRAELDPLSGEIVGSWSKFVGLGRLAVVPVTCGGSESILVTSRAVKTCLGHVSTLPESYISTGGNSAPFFQLDAISGEPLDLAHSFQTQDCPNGVIGVAGSTLKIFTVETSARWTQNEVSLPGTSKRLIQHENKTLVVSQDPHRLVCVESDVVVTSKDLPGRPHSVCSVVFDDKQYFAVGGESSSGRGYIAVFSSGLGHVHTTDLEVAPLALCEFSGMLLAGVGAQVRLYALGLKQLLRKAQTEVCKRVTCVDVFPGSNRVAVGDIRQSVTVLVHLEHPVDGHELYPLVCDRIQRQVTCLKFVDYETVAVGDRFGGFSMLRVPVEASKLADEDHNAVHLRQLEGTLNGSAHYRFQQVVSYHLEDVPMSIGMSKGMLVVSCLLGTVTAFVPVPTDKEARHLKNVEKYIAELDVGLMGRDHLKFRGFYVPVQDVVDGDLLDGYLVMERGEREKVGERVGLEVEDVVGRVVNMRKLL